MKVLQLVSQANPQAVLHTYLEAYGTLHGHTPQTVAKWQALVQQSTPVSTPMQVVISIGEYGGFIVDGQQPGHPTKYALDLIPWGEWGQMEVVDTTDKNLTLDQQAAHLFYEMTWHGWPEEIEAFADKLHDSVEQVQRAIAEAKARGEDETTTLLNSGFKRWQDIFPPEEEQS